MELSDGVRQCRIWLSCEVLIICIKRIYTMEYKDEKKSVSSFEHYYNTDYIHVHTCTHAHTHAYIHTILSFIRTFHGFIFSRDTLLWESLNAYLVFWHWVHS